MSPVPLQPPPANPTSAPSLWSAPPAKGRTGSLAFAVTGIVIAG